VTVAELLHAALGQALCGELRPQIDPAVPHL
jgi:hypothetical protein